MKTGLCICLNIPCCISDTRAYGLDFLSRVRSSTRSSRSIDISFNCLAFWLSCDMVYGRSVSILWIMTLATPSLSGNHFSLGVLRFDELYQLKCLAHDTRDIFHTSIPLIAPHIREHLPVRCRVKEHYCVLSLSR